MVAGWYHPSHIHQKRPWDEATEIESLVQKRELVITNIYMNIFIKNMPSDTPDNSVIVCLSFALVTAALELHGFHVCSNLITQVISAWWNKVPKRLLWCQRCSQSVFISVQWGWGQVRGKVCYCQHCCSLNPSAPTCSQSLRNAVLVFCGQVRANPVLQNKKRWGFFILIDTTFCYCHKSHTSVKILPWNEFWKGVVMCLASFYFLYLLPFVNSK